MLFGSIVLLVLERFAVSIKYVPVVCPICIITKRNSVENYINFSSRLRVVPVQRLVRLQRLLRRWSANEGEVGTQRGRERRQAVLGKVRRDQDL